MGKWLQAKKDDFGDLLSENLTQKGKRAPCSQEPFNWGRPSRPLGLW